MYTCKKCLRSLSTDRFYKDKRISTGHRGSCKDCDRSAADKEGQRRRSRKHYTNNADAHRLRSRSWKLKNADRVAAYNREYDRLRADVRAALNVKRSRSIRQAVPPWYDALVVRSIYARARALTESTGIAHEVDHIIPLCNPRVCGLHVQDNLRVITKTDNRKKHNYFDQIMS